MTIKKDAKRGTWYFIVDLPPVAGKRQQLKRRGFATKRLATAAESDVVSDVRRGSFVRPIRGTVEEYLNETWLQARRVNLRASTVHGYEKVIRLRIVPYIGDVQFSMLDTATIERLYATLLASGGEKGRSLAPKTVANTAGVLSIALRDAVRLKLLPHNVANDARLPSRGHKEMTAWTEAEAAAFLATVATGCTRSGDLFSPLVCGAMNCVGSGGATLISWLGRSRLPARGLSPHESRPGYRRRTRERGSYPSMW
jgi:integrase